MREKFVRLQQIGTLLNLDHVRPHFFLLEKNTFYSVMLMVVWCSIPTKQEEDVDEFFNGSGITWKLSEQEARAVAGLRI